MWLLYSIRYNTAYHSYRWGKSLELLTFIIPHIYKDSVKPLVPEVYDKYRLKVIEDDPLDIKRIEIENEDGKMKLVTDYAGWLI